MKPEITCRYAGPDTQRFAVTIRRGCITKTEILELKGACHGQLAEFCGRHGLDPDEFLQALLRAAEDPVVSAS